MEGGGWRVSTNLNTSEGNLFPVLCDEERPSRVLVVQHGSQLEDLQILITNVLDGGNDPQFGHKLDLVGGSRERNLETGGGANHGLGISTDGRKIKSKERQREHGDGKVRATGLRLGIFQPRHLYTSWSARFRRRIVNRAEREHEISTGGHMQGLQMEPSCRVLFDLGYPSFSMKDRKYRTPLPFDASHDGDRYFAWSR